MIRKTLPTTQAATFSVITHRIENNTAYPSPVGTGFFISADGYFVTAAHVVTDGNTPIEIVCNNIKSFYLSKEWGYKNNTELHGELCHDIELVSLLPKCDFALLKVDFKKNANKVWLEKKTGFPFIEITTQHQEEGTPVYAFGYPLGATAREQIGSNLDTLVLKLSPRTTSAIISSNIETTYASTPRVGIVYYVLDKALNYGNSGGPIINSETGKVFAFCSRFQPVYVKQPHLYFDKKGVDNSGVVNQQDLTNPSPVNHNFVSIALPSLYGIVSSLSNVEIVEELQKNNISIS